MSQEAPRVGIVLVSHSVRLAEGAADLAGQVSGGTVRVLAAGGTDDGELGTSADKVAEAVAGAEAVIARESAAAQPVTRRATESAINGKSLI